MSPEKLADSLARKARRRPLTPEQLSRAMEAEDFDLSGWTRCTRPQGPRGGPGPRSGGGA